MDNKNIKNLVEEILSRNKILEDKNKQIIGISKEILQELQNLNNKLVKMRKIGLTLISKRNSDQDSIEEKLRTLIKEFEEMPDGFVDIYLIMDIYLINNEIKRILKDNAN